MINSGIKRIYKNALWLQTKHNCDQRFVAATALEIRQELNLLKYKNKEEVANLKVIYKIMLAINTDWTTLVIKQNDYKKIYYNFSNIEDISDPYIKLRATAV